MDENKSILTKIKAFFAVQRNFNIFAAVFLIATATTTFLVVRSIMQNDSAEFTDQETHDILAEIAQNNNSEVFADLESTGSASDDDSRQGVPSIQGEMEKDLAESGDPTINSPLPTVIPTTPILNPDDPKEDTGSGGIEQDILDSMPPHPELLTNVYRSATTDYTPGPKASMCWYYSDEDYSRESAEYFDNEHSFRSYGSFDVDGDIIGESSYKYGTGVHNSEYYAGGDFVGRRAYDRPEYVDLSWKVETDSYPNPIPVDDAVAEDNAIRARFGTDAYISGVEEDGDKLYYYITAPSYAYCGTDYTAVWHVYKVDTDDFMVIQVKSFLESIRASNLLSTRDVESTREEIEYAVAVDRFDIALKHSVSSVTVDYENYVYNKVIEANKAIAYLEEAAQELLWPTEQAYSLYGIYGSDFPERVENERYYQRRDFYSDDIKGQERWESVDEYRKSIGDLKLYFGDNRYEYFSISTKYAGNDSGEAPMAGLLVNGQPRGASISQSVRTWRMWSDITLPSSYPISYPTSYAVSYPDSYGGYGVLRYDSEVVMYGDSIYPGESGVEYKIRESSYYNRMIQHRPYSLYAPSDTREFAPLKELISGYYDGIAHYYY